MSILETAFGGILAAGGGALVLYLERRGARSDAEQSKKDNQSAVLFSMILKLQQMHAWNLAIKRNIDECFESAGDPLGEMDPGVKVIPMVLPAVQPDVFTSDELALAFSTKDNGLMERLLSVATNFQANLQTLREFNLLRREHMSFVQTNAIAGKFVAGDLANVELPQSKTHAYESHVALLNQLVGALMTGTTDGVEECKVVLRRLCTAASSITGLAVPNVILD